MSFATTKNKIRILTKTQNKKLHAFTKTIYINSVFREKKTKLGPLQKHKTKSLSLLQKTKHKSYVFRDNKK